MSSNLPVSALQAGTLLANALLVQNEADRQLVIEWGFRQIDAEYPEDPLRAPLNPIKRLLARQEWERVIRTNGRELRGVVASAAVAELTFQLERRHQQLLADDAEANRQRTVLFDADINLRLTTELANRELERQLRLMERQHELTQHAADNDSRRRIDEQLAAADQEIRRILIEAVIKASGATSAEETIGATRLVNEEITRIRHDPNLSPDEQHVEIKALLDTLPHIVRNLRPHDV